MCLFQCQSEVGIFAAGAKLTGLVRRNDGETYDQMRESSQSASVLDMQKVE